MPVSNKPGKRTKKSKVKPAAESHIDIVFAGPLLLVPSISEKKIASVEVFSPLNGRPIGAIFVPGVLFSDAELDDPKCERWPDAESFSLLDPHSYAIEVTQNKKEAGSAISASAIPQTNHKISPGRRLSPDWQVAIAVRGNVSRWSSHRLTRTTGLFHGADTPTAETAASLHRLSFQGVKGVDFPGAAKEPRDYLQANAGKGGTLIVIGEIPYQSTLLHERKAIESIARLAGLDLHLAETNPKSYQTRLMGHITSCGLSIIVTD